MKAGDKVVCVDNSHSPMQPWMWPFERMLDKSTVYILSEVDEADACCGGGGIVWLLGFPPPPCHNGVEWLFEIERFRLVSEAGHPPIQVEQPEPATV